MPLPGDALGEFGVALGIEEVEAGAADRNRAAASSEGSGMARRIDAKGETARDRQADRREVGREIARRLQPVGGGMARADHRQLWRQQTVGLPTHEQHRGCIGNGQ